MISLFCMCLTLIIPPVTHIISHSHSLTTQNNLVSRDIWVFGELYTFSNLPKDGQTHRCLCLANVALKMLMPGCWSTTLV